MRLLGKREGDEMSGKDKCRGRIPRFKKKIGGGEEYQGVGNLINPALELTPSSLVYRLWPVEPLVEPEDLLPATKHISCTLKISGY